MVYSWIKCLLMLCITGNIPNVGLNLMHCKGAMNKRVYQTVRQLLNAENIFIPIFLHCLFNDIYWAQNKTPIDENAS
ncbi:hypothetical protein CLV42_10831 [Chitinophaga ginsengisoli]|uniref:Uncharacterized protein n=1 Tax=Chitinophaga ginsengisoli TaxID=363837 RepID=A0A2P8G2A6_9BACT|nr:hypothetical protein CLV42_10831 [Chitinophaga ginsengisoli]